MAPRSWRRLSRNPLVLAGLAMLVIAAGVGAYLFQPWKLFTNTTVDEALPTVVVEESSDGGAPASAAPEVVSSGTFITQEHDTTGTAQLLRLADDSLVVRVENLDTSDGPLLKVWLTDAPVSADSDDWSIFDDGRYVDLGPLKGNKGTANYAVPEGADVSGLSSVSIWCDRFNVSFGAAELASDPAAA